MRLICEGIDSKLYLDGDKYVIIKEKKGEIVGQTEYKVKDWVLCPWDCHKKFGYKIIDMEYVSDVYKNHVMGKQFEHPLDVVKRNKELSKKNKK